MENRFFYKWKESLFVWRFDFFVDFFSKTFENALSSFCIYFKKFWFIILGMVATSVSLLFLILDFDSVVEAGFVIPGGGWFCHIQRFVLIFSSLKTIDKTQINIKALVLLGLILMVFFLINSFLPFIITKEYYDKKEYNYLSFFKNKFFGLVIKLPLLWAMFFAVLKYILHFRLLQYCASFFLGVVVIYSIYLYSDGLNNKAFKTQCQTLKLFVYNLPAFIFFHFVFFIINLIIFIFFLLILLLLFLLLAYVSVSIILTSLIFLFLFLFHISYFLNLSAANNFYLVLKDKNSDILKLEEL